METAVAYYKDGVPYDDKGQVIITLLNGTPDGSGSGGGGGKGGSKSESSAAIHALSLIHISEPTRRGAISYAVFCLKKRH